MGKSSRLILIAEILQRYCFNFSLSLYKNYKYDRERKIHLYVHERERTFLNTLRAFLLIQVILSLLNAILAY